MESNFYKSRRNDLDLLKAFGIILMVMGHIGFGEVFDKWIHAFHMPIFFFVSGILYKKISLKALLIKRIKTLLIPYIVVGLTHCLLFIIKEKSVSVTPFEKLLYNTVQGGTNCRGLVVFNCSFLYGNHILFN